MVLIISKKILSYFMQRKKAARPNSRGPWQPKENKLVLLTGKSRSPTSLGEPMIATVPHPWEAPYSAHLLDQLFWKDRASWCAPGSRGPEPVNSLCLIAWGQKDGYLKAYRGKTYAKGLLSRPVIATNSTVQLEPYLMFCSNNTTKN